MSEFAVERLLRKSALNRVQRIKGELEIELKWFKDLTEREQFDLALRVLLAQKSLLQMGRMFWDLIPAALAIAAIIIAAWK